METTPPAAMESVTVSDDPQQVSGMPCALRPASPSRITISYISYHQLPLGLGQTFAKVFSKVAGGGGEANISKKVAALEAPVGKHVEESCGAGTWKEAPVLEGRYRYKYCK